MAHLATVLAYYLAKQSVGTCPSVLIYSLSRSKVPRIHLAVLPSAASPACPKGVVCHYCCVSSPGLLACLLSLFMHRARSRLVTKDVTDGFSLKVRFVVLKYDTSNVALNGPSHVSHLTVWGPQMIRQISDHYKRMSNVFFVRLAIFIAVGVLANKPRVNFI